MNRLLLVFLCLTGLSLATNAQRIPPGADGIELNTALTDSVLIESMHSFLENEGFTLQEVSEESGKLVTDYKIASGVDSPGAVAIRLLVSVENGVALVSGEAFYERNGTSQRDEPLANDGEESDPGRVGFGQMSALISRFAQTLQQVTMEYVLP